MNEQGPGGLTNIPELDGIRGIAIIAVLGFHFGHVLPFPGDKLFALGWAGVDLFFVLSGFLITRILWTTREDQGYFKIFYARRILRILPLAFAFLAAYFWVALPISHHFGYDLDRNGSDQIWYWLYLSNWHPGHYGSLTHLWSLAVEEQFYLVWPAIVFVLSRKNLQRLCVVLVALPLLLRWLFIIGLHFPSLFVQATICRTEALALGALIAISTEVRFVSRTAIPAAIGVLAIAAEYKAESQFMGIYGLSLVALACAGFVQRAVRFAGTESVFSTMLRSRWLRRFGKYSYAIYVLHAPIVAVTFHLYARKQAPLSGCLLFVVGIACSYAAGWLSWRFFESKILRLKRYVVYGQAESLPIKAAAESSS